MKLCPHCRSPVERRYVAPHKQWNSPVTPPLPSHGQHTIMCTNTRCTFAEIWSGRRICTQRPIAPCSKERFFPSIH